MARQNQGLALDIVDIATKLPWWVGVLLALASYFLLHHYATRELVVSATTGALSGVAGPAFVRGILSIFQYVIPAALLVGAAVSAYSRLRASKLHQSVANSSHRQALNNMSWREFESLVGEYFRREGYQVNESGGGGADGGVDIRLTKGTERYLVQCKQWRAYKVGVPVVRELYGVMAAESSAGGFVVTSGEYTAEAINFARGRNITLLDGSVLHGLIRQSQPLNPVDERASGQPECPICKSSMVLRTAKRGSHAGENFWGCSRYPKCRGTMSYR